MSLERKIFSISEINRFARLCLEDNFSGIWIEGEISNFVKPSSGHCYFSLKDSNAQIRCALFSMYQRRLNFKPENGMHVVVFGKISLYENRGDYQFIAEAMEEVGNGKLQRAFELLKQKLSAEGLFDHAIKKPLPTLPKQIGIITSPSGAAVRDILKLLRNRFPLIPVVIYPTLVQGEAAPENIVRMISIANQRKECDVLILARGGGSLEDLWAFNTESVARAIFASEIPTISAVGHEIDFTIADFVADYRAPTPSAAAVCITPDQQEWFTQFKQFKARLLRQMLYSLRQKKERLTLLRSRLPHPLHLLRERIQRVDEIEQRLVRAIKQLLILRQHQLDATTQALDVISPLSTLRRGYALAFTQDQKMIRHAKDVTIGEPILIKLSEGELKCEVLASVDNSLASNNRV